ncbi:hypothetical protein [Maricaulis sp.]|uniref:hypothetical protein n=1 Tax=Maricaulis sp. TaxID=1486257 RepID=UPI003A944ACF
MSRPISIPAPGILTSSDRYAATSSLMEEVSPKVTELVTASRSFANVAARI